jgi:predicted nucleic acid-binding Zn ribbon protein
MPLGDLLRRNARSLGIEPAVHLVEIRRVWESVVGPALAAASRVASFRGGVLVVSATHPLVAQEIRMRRRAILAAVETRAGAAPSRLQVVIRREAK